MIGSVGIHSLAAEAAVTDTAAAWINAKAAPYGAVGDGVADDTVALTAAIAAAGATTSSGLGATVYLPPGTYRTTGITLRDSVQLRGAGQRASRLQGIGAVTVLTAAVSSVVSDLHVRGDSTAGSVGVDSPGGSHHWSLADCWVTGHGTGIRMANTWIVALSRVTVQACTTGIRFAGPNVNAICVTGGEIKGCVVGVHSTSTGAMNNVVFHAATIEGNSGYGIHQAGTPYGFRVRDCYFESNAGGHFYQSAQSRSLAISGCTFSGRAPFSIKLDTGLDTLIEGCSFGLSTAGATSITCLAPVSRTAIIKNWYALSQEFVRSVHYAGTSLTQIDREVVFPPSSAAVASINIPHGSAPKSPKNGDVWTTTAGLFVRINGATVGPIR